MEQLALLGGSPAPKEAVVPVWPIISERDIDARQLAAS